MDFTSSCTTQVSRFTSVARCDVICYFQQPIVISGFTSQCPTVTLISVFNCNTIALSFTSSYSSAMSSFNYSSTTIMRWRSRLRHCATSRKVAGSIPEGVKGIFHRHNPSGHTVALGLTQPLTEMSTRIIFWGVKAAGA